MRDVFIVRDCDGHTQRVILRTHPEGVEFSIAGRNRWRLVKGATIAQVKSHLRKMGNISLGGM
jgi:hypothetical protein